MITSLWLAVGTLTLLILGAGVLHLLPRLGGAGRRVSAALCRAPGLDAVVTYFTVLPLFVGPIVAGWWGLLGAVAGQCATILAWTLLHELANPHARRGPRIVKVLNRVVGTWRNHAALWVMVPAVPVFWLIRVAQLTIYPSLSLLVGLPRYPMGEWVNVSRTKFEGLVGHDLIWCLYCDWMTGLWSIGSEMLRNIESMWCPIRFADGKKCENCKLDFPDVFGVVTPDGRRLESWTDASGTMADVAALMDRQYAQTLHRGWFGHPARLTIEGREPAPQPVSQP